MKNRILFAVIIFISFFALSCESGTTSIQLKGDETLLPEELKGLRVYSVATENWGSVRVAVLNGEVNSLTYPVGKTTQTTIVVNKDRYNERLIEAEEVLSETDDIIVIRKKR